MVLTTFFVALISVWICLWSIHRLSIWNVRRRLVPSNASSAVNLDVQIGYASLETAALNSTLYSFGRRHRRFLRVWFSAGVVFAFCGMMAVVTMLLLDVTRGLRSSIPAGPTPPQRFIVPVVPGVNLPWRHMGYLTAATLFSMAVHEAGHAIAAAREGVQTERVALFVALLFPGAMVVLHAEAMDSLRPWSSLRVYCAGVWHNAVLCLVCYLLIASLPLLLLPTFTSGSGVTVTGVPRVSPLHAHIHPGDRVTAINGHEVWRGKDWVDLLALESATSHEADRWHPKLSPSDQRRTLGYCWPKESLFYANTSVPCPTGTTLFVEVVGNEPLLNKEGRRGCLPARQVAAGQACRNNGGGGEEEDNFFCPSKALTCVYPHLPTGVSFLKITFLRPSCSHLATPKYSSNDPNVNTAASYSTPERNKDLALGCEDFVLFAGSPAALGMALRLSDYSVRTQVRSFLGPLVDCVIRLPGLVEHSFVFTFQVSAALALLNLAPVFYLDGEAVVHAALALLFPRVALGTRRRTATALLIAGSLLLVVTLAQGLRTLL